MCQSESQCAGEGLRLTPGLNPKKSGQPSKKAGAATAGNTDGVKTDLSSQQNLAAIVPTRLTFQWGGGLL